MPFTCPDYHAQSPDPLLVAATSDLTRDEAHARALDNAALACAALALVEEMCRAASAEAAGRELVNRLRSFLSADGVALGMVRGPRRCRLVASAGVAEMNASSELSAAIQQALQCSIHADSRPAACASACDALGKLLGDAAVDQTRLCADAENPIGAVLIWGGAAEFDRTASQRFLQFASQPIASALALVQRRTRGGLLTAFYRALGARRGLFIAALLAITIALAFLAPYRITCDCAAEPFKRRFVSAPFAGVFATSLVRPGDVVEQNQLLGQMDGRELRIELAGVTADYERVRKSYDINLASGKVAAAQMDKLELERLEQQRRLLESRMENLEIRSPVEGYVISGDLKRTEGAPLSVGQVLYEIAPLEAMTVELAIDDREISQIAVGQLVSIQFDALPGEPLTGRLARIHPRSETRDSRNVFIGEVFIEGAGGALRPGMKGKARIVIDGESLGGGLLRRGWHAAARRLGLP